MIDDRHPVIVATGQVIERDELVTPVELMARAAEVCLGEVPTLRGRVQQVSVVDVFSGAGRTPASDLALRLAIQPQRAETTAVGGNAPQWLVSRVADSIWSGDLDVALIAGGEAQRSAWARTGKRGGGQQHEGQAGEIAEADPVVGDERLGFGDVELGAGLLAPVHVYPLFESVIAHEAGRTYAQQREFIGRLLSPMTSIAASNDCAWFPIERSPTDISGLSAENRLVSDPYSKRMCAFLGVDQAASIVMCSYGVARAQGIADRCVFCWSGADASEVWFPSARPDPGQSPGLRVAGNAALRAASLDVDDLRWLDFYSCFPCVVEMACEALGVSLDDSRGLTVTGGLPYFGGPGNAYTLFAIATMADLLRKGASDGSSAGGRTRSSTTAFEAGLVSGLGWYATKHSVGVYASVPNEKGWSRGDTDREQQQIDQSALPTTVEVPDPGMSATVAASTVHYDSTGQVTGAPVLATLDDGRRVAAGPADSVKLSDLDGVSLVGERVHVAGSPPLYQPL